MRRFSVVLSAVVLCSFVLSVAPFAQSKPTLKPAEYDKFESVSPGGGRGGLSPDAKWFAYAISKGSGDGELHVAPLGGGTTSKTIQNATNGTFASNSQWMAYLLLFWK